MHIGIVEDDPDQLALLNVWLTRADHRVQGFHTVAHAISALSQEPVGLLLVDWRLPDATGADLIEWVRSNLGWTLPILVLTASREEHIVLAALAAGADDFVLIPVRHAFMMRDPAVQEATASFLKGGRFGAAATDPPAAAGAP